MRMEQLLTLRFDGSDYDHAVDGTRLSGQFVRIFNLMADGAYRTLNEIQDAAAAPAASVSAQLRHMRKPRFGGHTIDKRRRGAPGNGLWEYRLVINKQEAA